MKSWIKSSVAFVSENNLTLVNAQAARLVDRLFFEIGVFCVRIGVFKSKTTFFFIDKAFDFMILLF